jgi:gamma-glutamylaminecyclotransferase
MEHRVFVYGTLKQGFPNFHVNRGRRIAGDFVTVEPHPLHILGPDRLPWLVQSPGQGQRVSGQVFAVDDAGLAAMDVLEQIDEPGWYRRERIAVRPTGDGDVIEPWVYFGVSARLTTDVLHAGPLGEYTLEMSSTYRHTDPTQGR